MKKNMLTFAVAATLGLAAFAATAEDMYRGAWYAVPGVSYMNTDSDLEANNGGGAFLKLGKELSEHWDIQGGLGYNRASEDTGIAGVSGRYKQTTLGLDALYMFSRDKFRPFLLAGLGVARNDVDYSHPTLDVDGKKTSWLANVGLGAQYLFNDSFGLQADLRHQWSRASVKVSDGATTASETDTIGNTLLSLGGIFRFGAPAPMPVAAVEPEPAPVAPAAVAPTPEPAPAPVACVPQYETITIEASKLFAFDEAKLKDTSVLDNEVVPKMKENKIFASVKVTGHTDKLGSEAYNQKLSEKRANQVRDYLIAQGIEADRLVAVGKGELVPVVSCDGVKGRKALIECLAPNRRVEIEATRSMEKGCK
ncbi:outer membrane beta-barrel protein [Methylotenera mobilis]|uniref:OmpA/MotB domain protein n=1 Tax=Methylotenera mobilis (strain JLW8 / ATCC BAA-1282 / DSM 17540) TaxID=583345 RepID=C6WV60_METML|nr:outer membrane beta-barrel protein [Methylotenera mobilis]ACT47809.1 OmpA/MotB domain protein [Methylotenera mobilis JLW8]